MIDSKSPAKVGSDHGNLRAHHPNDATPPKEKAFLRAKNNHPLGVGFKHFFIFTPKIGEMIQFDEHIFQMGWNHQLDRHSYDGLL